MKKLLLILLCIIFLFSSLGKLNAQQYCGTAKLMRLAGPSNYYKQLFKSYQQSTTKARNSFTIPVVVHVVYNSSVENIPDSIKIAFKGLVTRDLAIEHMLEADVYISLSKGEGLPIAVLEAMYAGCFMILSTIPPHREVSPPSERCFFVDISNLKFWFIFLTALTIIKVLLSFIK